MHITLYYIIVNSLRSRRSRTWSDLNGCTERRSKQALRRGRKGAQRGAARKHCVKVARDHCPKYDDSMCAKPFLSQEQSNFRSCRP